MEEAFLIYRDKTNLNYRTQCPVLVYLPNSNIKTRNLFFNLSGMSRVKIIPK